MQHYHLRDYEMKLLGELQRQQNRAEFCDTLLQTEGISVPTHSCVLAAFSPYLSQKLSSTPSPPSGQKRQLHLQSLKAHTLLKLVGLLYSGGLEVNGSVEKNDVMDAVQKFGIAPLIERQRNESAKDMEIQENRVGICSKCCTLTVAVTVADRECANFSMRKDAHVHPEVAGQKDTHCSAKKRSCVSTGTQTPLDNQTHPETLEHFTFQSQNFPLDVYESISYQPSASTSPTANGEVYRNQSCSSSDHTSFSERLQNGCSDSSGSALVLTQTKDQNKTSRDEAKKMTEDENPNSTERRPAFTNIAKKNLAKMKLVKSTQISFKVKLRRRKAKEKLWEVVSIQDEDETTSGFAPLSQEAHPTAALTSDHHVAQAEPSCSTKLPSHLSTIPGPSHHFIDDSAPHQNGTPPPACVPQPQGLAEESDEQIQKLLEDIMMGLNILPDLGVPDGDTGQSKIPSAECQHFQNIVEQSAHTSTNAAQKQLDSKSVPLGESSGVKIPHQPFLLDPSSVRQTNRLSHHDRNYPPVPERQPLSLLSPPWLNDLRLPRCLSPIKSFPSVGMNDPVARNCQLPHCARPLIPEHSGLLIFHGEHKHPHLLKARRNSRPMQRLKKPVCEPQQSLSCTRPRIKNRARVCPTAAERKSYPQKIKKTLVCKNAVAMDGNAPPKKRKVCIDYPQDATGSICDRIKSKTTMSICSVSMSRNNVLAKERNLAKGSEKSPPIFSAKQNQESTAKNHLKERSRNTVSSKSVSSCQTRLKTTAFMKTTQVPSSVTCPQSMPDTKSEALRPSVASNQVGLFKRKRGRPSKKRKACFSPNTAPAVILSDNQKNIEKELSKIDLGKSNVAKGKRPKMRNGKGEEAVTLKRVKSAAQPSEQYNKPKQTVAFKELQTFLKAHNLRTQANESRDDHEDVDVIELQEESSANVSVAVNQTGSPVLNESTEEKDLGRSSRKAVLSDAHPSANVVKRSIPQQSEGDQTQTTHMQELNSVVVPPQNYNPGCSPCDRQPSRQNQMPLELNGNPQIGTCLPATTGSPKSPEGSKEGTIEVDVLLSSPEKMPFTWQRECFVSDTDATQSDEEGEIDVTGDA
ncbi:uncharacterized protein LOC127612549 [Hippocampus zosterae]|uniref:uncharacterized protein LOC127612549 n=1 Tax=Hippocampus zosterae TaxID=109293 RepID=UPI00223D3FEE|nr:uncharacterized protein LOC127612549 [Hippocampus zosterae]